MCPHPLMSCNKVAYLCNISVTGWAQLQKETHTHYRKMQNTGKQMSTLKLPSLLRPSPGMEKPLFSVISLQCLTHPSVCWGAWRCLGKGFNKYHPRAGERAQQLRALAAPLENFGSVPSTYTEVHNCNSSSRGRIWCTDRHTQETH